MALEANERCIVGKRRWWRQMRGNDSVAVAGRQVTQCDSRVALMAAAEGMAAADKRGAAMMDMTDKR